METINEPSSTLRHHQRLGLAHSLLLAAVALAVLVPGMWITLVDRDEGWYAQVSREMLERGDWLVPHYLGQTWLAKPPLLYWLVATSFKLFGVGEWQARLVPVLASTISVLLVGALAARMFNRRVGLLAGLIFCTCGLSVFVGRMLLTDSLMLACLLAAVLLHWQIAAHAGTSYSPTGPRPHANLSRHLRAAGYWLAIGLGVLAKGPAILLFAGAFTLALLVSSRRDGSAHAFGVAAKHQGTWLRDWRWWLWLPLALLVAAPWYGYVARHAGPAFRQQMLGYEIFSRIAGVPHGHTGPPGYYLLISLAGLLPWTALVPGTVANAIREFRLRNSPPAAASDPRVHLLLVWLALPWILLELIRSKLPHYILPCYVPLAILLARQVERSFQASRPWSTLPKGERAALRLWTTLMIALGLAVILAAAWAAWTLHPAPNPSLPNWPLAACVAGAVLLGFAIVQRQLSRHGPGRAAWRTAAGVIVGFHLVLGLWLLPALEPYRLSRRLAETLNQLAQPGERVYLAGYDEPTVYFYLHAPARPLNADAQGELLASPGAPAVVASTLEAWEQLDPALQGRLAWKPAHGPNWLQTHPDRLTGWNYVKMRRTVIHYWRVGG